MSLLLLGGTKVVAASAYVAPDWEILRDFNTGPAGTSTNAKPDGFNSDGSGSLYTTDQVFSGAFSCKVTITAGTTGGGEWGGIIYPDTILVKGDTLWFELYYYMPDSYVIETTPNWLKYLRFRQRQSGGAHRGFLDLYLNDDDAGTPTTTYRWILEGQGLWVPTGPNRRFLRDQWVRQTVQIIFDDVAAGSGGNGKVRFWENGTLLLDSTTLQTLNASTDECWAFYLHTYWNNGNAPRTQSSYVDNIRMAKNGRPSWTLDLPGV